MADFLVCKVSGFAVGQQDATDVTTITSSYLATIARPNGMLPDDFNQLFGGRSIGNAILKLSGIRTVETFAGHNNTPKPVGYYCPSITVGGEEPEDAPPDVQWCTEQLPASGST